MINLNTNKTGELSESQVYDLFCFVISSSGCSTGTIEPPELPAGSEYFFITMGNFDCFTVYLVNGFPVAASDEMSMTHWFIQNNN